MYYNNNKVLGTGQGCNGVYRLNSDVNHHQPVRNYISDGHGRDTYITYGNGGFIKNNCNFFPVTGAQIGEHGPN